MVVLANGCRKQAPRVAVPPPVRPGNEQGPNRPELGQEGPILPEQAESREDRGEQEVGENVKPSGPSAMFQTALQYLAGSEQDRAIALFRDLLSLYPESPYETQVRLFLSLTSRMRLLEGELKGREEKVRRLSEELEKLKEIILRESAVRPPE